MNINTLNKINQAPESGIILSYLRDKVVFERYSSVNEVLKKLEGKNILELHLFDNSKEYRAISSTSKRFETGSIEDVIDFAYKADECFISGTILDSDKRLTGGVEKLYVLNHLAYDENGSVSVDNYRLCEEV